MARDTTDERPIEGRDDLIAWIAAGSKPAAAGRIGTEHEKFPYFTADHGAVPYEGPAGIGVLIERLGERLGWEAIRDGEAVIGLADPHGGGGAISLEPGGQFELSGAPLVDLHATAAELAAHLADVAAVADPLGIAFAGLGTSPKWTLAETPAMPKSRYRIMAGYMPKVGTRGRDMMFRTSTVQVNLDFASEADMVAKLRVGLALQPIATALFAASPFLDGRPSGYLSTRSAIWLDTDRHRTGMLPQAFDAGFGFGGYVDWALDVPMYFVKRGDTYHDVTGTTFRAFLDGALAERLPGVVPEIGDWTNHVGTLFPEVRLKRYLEMRGADCGPASHVVALPALWVGLLYDPGALEAAGRLIADWTTAEQQALRDAVPRSALATPFRSGTVRDVARELLAIARSGLAARAIVDSTSGRDETVHLDVLDEIVASGQTLADRLLADFHGPWAGAIDRVLDATRY
ncbi:glutamate--cysteine ligase [Siculibacillus lacustris]|uniref:Glutamate--cysteine ligase n=1 Tax=Siculibacillus lacustris TaxID=1549641 RepID=A0A4Q9VNH9_9HYPH|nr:glutamate--cysteine ligase [Siculibacillus lacustris]TBW37205.1 glutamate--cysteine ligase [Siculibacillus lacustris]